MDLKSEIINVLKAGGELIKAGTKKLGELISAVINHLNEKTKLQMQQQQQFQKQECICQTGNYIHSELIRVFLNRTVPVGLATVRSAGDILPLGVTHVHDNVFAFHFSWTKSTTNIFCEIQTESIREKLNQMLILARCDFIINKIMDRLSFFELVIHYPVNTL